MPKTRLTAALCSSKTSDTAFTRRSSDEPQSEPVTTDRDPPHPQSDSAPRLASNNGCSFDANLEGSETSDSTDSDDDLPDMPFHQADKVIPEKGDPVWVKYRQHNFWPSLVLQSNQKTRKLRVLFLDQLNGQDADLGEKIYMKYNKKNVMPFTTERNKRYEADGKALTGDLRKRFITAMSTMDDYLTKRALGLTDACKVFLNDSTSVASDNETDKQEKPPPQQSEQRNHRQQRQPHRQQQQQNAEDDSEQEEEENGEGALACPADTTTTSKSRKRKLNPDERRELRKGRNQPLVDYICSAEMKDYLVKIFKGKIPSERHEQFHKGVSQQNKLQYNSLGPIDDDEQLEKITEHLGGWLAEVTDQLFPNSNYLFGVWLPEAIVKAIVKVRRCSRQRAWEVFSQGVRLVKCERLEIHNSMIQKT